jgi:phosphohistidine phosphatase SixA
MTFMFASRWSPASARRPRRLRDGLRRGLGGARAWLARVGGQVAVILTLLAIPADLAAQGAVILVRHAERADAGMVAPPGADPDLSEAGLARAQALAAALKDAGIARIFVSKYKRTAQTAAPLATLLGLKPVVLPPEDAEALRQALQSGSGNVLVIGHSNTLPPLLKALGVTDPVTIPETEFDNLFVVMPGARPSLLRLRYR